MLRIKKDIQEEKGQSLVEFALILPVLIILIFGMIEFGWLLNAKITLNSAVREGARVGAVINATDTERETKVMEAVQKAAEASGLEILLSESSIEDEDSYIKNIHNIKVIVTAEVDSIIGLFVSDKVTMTSDAVMRKE